MDYAREISVRSTIQGITEHGARHINGFGRSRQAKGLRGREVHWDTFAFLWGNKWLCDSVRLSNSAPLLIPFIDISSKGSIVII